MKIKPCPFCGGKASFFELVVVYAFCTACKASVAGDTLEEAANKWNQRHNEPPMVDEVPNLDSQKREVLP